MSPPKHAKWTFLPQKWRVHNILIFSHIFTFVVNKGRIITVDGAIHLSWPSFTQMLKLSDTRANQVQIQCCKTYLKWPLLPVKQPYSSSPGECWCIAHTPNLPYHQVCLMFMLATKPISINPKSKVYFCGQTWSDEALYYMNWLMILFYGIAVLIRIFWKRCCTLISIMICMSISSIRRLEFWSIGSNNYNKVSWALEWIFFAH